MKLITNISNRGFTMVELMVTIAIIGILASVAIPAFSHWIPNFRLKSAGRDIISSLQASKMKAVKENSDVVIWFDKTNDTYRAYLDNGAGAAGVARDGWQNGDERTLKDGTMPEGIDMYNVVFSALVNQTSFNNKSVAAGGWGYVWLKNNRDRYIKITVWTTGNIQLQTSTDGTNWS